MGRRKGSVFQLNFCEVFKLITVLLWFCVFFVKDFFIQDINAGLKDETEIPEQLVPVSSLSEEQLENLIKKLRKASEGLNSTLKDQIMSHPALHDALNDPKNGDSATKHLKQQVCLGDSNSTKNGLLFVCQKLTFCSF